MQVSENPIHRKPSFREDHPSETIRKAPVGPEQCLRSRRNRSKKSYFAAPEIQNGASRGYSRPFSDSLSRIVIIICHPYQV
jgi:hypothetical protein